MTDAGTTEDALLARVRAILEAAGSPRPVMQPGNPALTRAYWEVGRALAEVGATEPRLLRALAERLTAELGPGLAVPTLRFLRDLYAAFPDPDALPTGLTVRHCRLLVPIPDDARRAFYADACVRAGWIPKQLKTAIAQRTCEHFTPSPEEEAKGRALVAATDPAGALSQEEWERAAFFHLADRHFAFLLDEYGMSIDPNGAFLIEQFEKDGPAYGYLYRNATTAFMVSLVYYWYTPHVSALVWKLEDGMLYADEPRLAEVHYLRRKRVGDWLGVASFVHDGDPDRTFAMLPDWSLRLGGINLPYDRAGQARAFVRNFEFLSDGLGRCCDDALRGDFANFDRVRAAVYARRD